MDARLDAALGGGEEVEDFADFAQYLAGRGVPVPILLTIGAIIVELGAGASLAIGYRIRWAAWILAAYTIAATIIGHPFWQGGADADANLVHALKNMAIVGGLLAANVAQSAFRARRP